MKKKFTNEEIGQAIGKIAEKIRDDMDYDFRVAQSQMWIAENDLADSLDEKQKNCITIFVKREICSFKLQENSIKENFKAI